MSSLYIKYINICIGVSVLIVVQGLLAYLYSAIRSTLGKNFHIMEILSLSFNPNQLTSKDLSKRYGFVPTTIHLILISQILIFIL